MIYLRLGQFGFAPECELECKITDGTSLEDRRIADQREAKTFSFYQRVSSCNPVCLLCAERCFVQRMNLLFNTTVLYMK